MNRREKFLDRLEEFPAREQAAVLMSAFEHAADDERTMLARSLARTDCSDAVRLLIRQWVRIMPTDRQMIARLPSDPQSVISHLLAGSDAQVLRSAVDFIRDRGEARLATFLAELISRGDADLRDHAAAVLLRLTVDHAGVNGRQSISSLALDSLDRTIAPALDSYRSHRCGDVLLAVAIMADRDMPRLQAILDQPDHPGTVALRSVPERIGEELVRANLIRWLGVRIMQRPVIRWLHAIRTLTHWNDVLVSGHLLAAPIRRRVLRRHPAPHRILPDITVAVQLDARAQANLVDWVRALGLTTPRRVAYLRDLIALPSPSARVKVIRSLVELAGAGVDDAFDALRSFARDSNELVARLAKRSLRHVGAPSRVSDSRDADEASIVVPTIIHRGSRSQEATAGL